MSEDFEGGLVWGVKQSFRDYIDSAPDGRIEVDDGVSTTSTGRFFFPVDRSESSVDGPGELRFGGRVVFSAHQGGLRLELAAPRIEGSRLTVLTEGGERAPIVTLELGVPETLDGSRLWRAVPTVLTDEGCALFNYIYPAGTALDPITIRLPSNTSVDDKPKPA